ncbi:MAG TPA: type 1 glutamine amidotransferase domain-containing protein [Phycisphaerae bacterium]
MQTKNTSRNLSGKKVAIVATDGFEEAELVEPKLALEQAGAKVDIIAPKAGTICSWDEKDWGMKMAVDRTSDSVNSRDYDALLLPGGVMNPDKLRRDQTVLRFVRSFFEAGKPVAAICHGPWTLIDAGVVKGRKMTSYESIQTDLKNAGAQWVDEPVVVDQGLVTSRKPADLPVFIAKLMEEIAEGVHTHQHA